MAELFSACPPIIWAVLPTAGVLIGLAAAGTALGLAVGGFAPSRLLTGLFAAIAASLAVTLVLGDRLVLALASAVGIGAGTLSTPVPSLFAFPLKRAIGAGALFNLIVAPSRPPPFPLFPTPAAPVGHTMCRAMSRCSAWRRHRYPRSLSRQSRLDGRRGHPWQCYVDCSLSALAVIAVRLLLRP